MQELYLDAKSIFLFLNFQNQILVSFPLQVLSMTDNSRIRQNEISFFTAVWLFGILFYKFILFCQ